MMKHMAWAGNPHSIKTVTNMYSRAVSGRLGARAFMR